MWTRQNMRFFVKLMLAMCLTALFVTVGSGPASKAYAATKKHTVTFIYGTTITQVQVRDGQTAYPPANTYVPGYTFIGWNASTIRVQSDMVVLGMYQVGEDPAMSSLLAVTGTASTGINTMPVCTVTFYNGNTKEILKKEQVPFGGSATPPENVCYGGYDFGYWVGDYTNVTTDREIMAVYYRTHRVEFKNRITDERIDLQYIRDGEAAREPKPDSMDGYKFTGYSRSLENIKEDDTVIYAEYEKTS